MSEDKKPEEDYNPFDKKKKPKQKTTWDVTGAQDEQDKKEKLEKSKAK